MAKRRRIPRKKLKEPDEFVSTAARMVLWTRENLRVILVGIIIVALVALSIVFWRIRVKTREAEAFNLLHRASEILDKAQDPSSRDYQEALGEFERIRREYPRTHAGQLAQLQLGDVFLNSKQYDKAAETYRQFLDNNPGERLYRLFALQGLGYAYEGQGDYQRALDSFRQLVDTGESFLQPWGYINMGRCYEKLGKREEALRAYRAFLEKFPDSTMAPMIRSRLGTLEGTKG